MNRNEASGKTPLLFLCHRIPYPPNKGDKIRAFHLLHHLHQHFDIYLATFVDDDDDWPHVEEVEKYCLDSLFVGLTPWLASLKSLRGFLSAEALSIPYYTSREMNNWVKRTVSEREIEHVIVYSSAMAQFVPATEFNFKRQIIDFVDIDSDKWQQYAQQKSWPMSWLFQREARKLLQLEGKLASQFDVGLFVSSAEAELFKQLCPDTADKIGFYNNGVNTKYFDPALVESNPYPEDVPVLVFTGAMDYWPNVDAVVWFTQQVLPQLREKIPQLVFYIVGGKPTSSVKKLAANEGVVVTGRVADVRPYIRYALAAVAPMRVARGVQNKVLEAMAMEKPVLVSSKGLEGIDAVHGTQLLLAEVASDYLNLLSQLVAGEFSGLGESARNHVTKNFNWDENLSEVVLLLEQGRVDSPGRSLAQ